MTTMLKGAFTAVTAGKINSATDFEDLPDYSLIDDELNGTSASELDLHIVNLRMLDADF